MVTPWLAALAIWEVTIDTTNGDVQDEIELLVEWGCVSLAFPWVEAAETTLLPEGGVGEVDFEDSV